MTSGNRDDMPDDGWISTWAEKPDWTEIWQQYRSSNQQEKLQLLVLAASLAGSRFAQEGDDPSIFQELALELRALRSGSRDTVFAEKGLPPHQASTLRPFQIRQAFLGAAVDACRAYLAAASKEGQKQNLPKANINNSISLVSDLTGHSFEEIEQARKDCRRKAGTKNYFHDRAVRYQELVASIAIKHSETNLADSLDHLRYLEWLCNYISGSQSIDKKGQISDLNRFLRNF